MTARKITVNAPKVDRELTFTYDFGDNLPQMIKLFGERIVYEHALDNMVIAAQGHARSRMMKEDDGHMTDRAIINSFKSWKPGGRTIDPAKRIARIDRDIEKLSPKELANFQKLIAKKLEARAKPELRKTPKALPSPEPVSEPAPEETPKSENETDQSV